MEIKVPFLNGPVGAGDAVKAVTSAVGVKPCTPCEERRKKFNQALQFVPRQTWTTPPNVPEGWEREATYEIEGKRLELFHHTSGKLIIWHVIDGRYKNSHTFCCGDRMRAILQLKWDELCRLL